MDLELERLLPFREKLTPERFARVVDVVRRRMCGITVVLENTYDPGNRNAVYRSAEGHGLTEVHLVRPELAQKRTARSVSRGAEKWLDVHAHAGTQEAVAVLKARGFRVAVADLRAAVPLQSLSFAEPTAIVFGNEKDGISEEMRSLADQAFVIPMLGFAGSYNVSVAAAMTLSWARLSRERALGRETDLTPAEADDLLFDYLMRAAKPDDLVELLS